MAAVDDKVNALNFQITTARPPSRIPQLIADAAEVSGATGPKTTLTQVAPNQIDGVMRNFVRVQMAEFTVIFDHIRPGVTALQFVIGDYLRTRETLFYFIPISPWGAPGYRTLKSFSDYLRSNL